MHKGFKCLDISSGRVYISRDVTFNEAVFSFSNLHPNAGARLRLQISILPASLLNPHTYDQGGEHVNDHMLNNPTNATNAPNEYGAEDAGKSKLNKLGYKPS